MKARIIRSAKRDFDCKRLDNDEVVQASSLGNIHKDSKIVVGDYVELEERDNNEYLIVSVDKRTSEIFRIQIRENKKKITAANVDLILIVLAVSKPEYKEGLVDRYLVRAEQWGVPALVILNKMDEHTDVDINFAAGRLEGLATCFEVSAINPNYKPKFLKNSMKELKKALEGKTAVLLGQSGVGKSKLITALSGVELLSRELAKVGKGSHTTTWAELIHCKTFDLIDSPGVRSMSVEDINPDDLISYYPDLQDLVVKCKFRDCQHNENTKGCYFENVDDAKIRSRLESYKRLFEELKQTPHWQRSF